MLKITQTQFEALSVPFRAGVIGRLVAFLSETAPGPFAEIKPEDRHGFVEAGIDAAGRLGIDHEAGVGMLMVLYLWYGPNLDRAPDPEGLRQILSQELDGRVKIEQIMAHLGAEDTLA